MSRSEYRAEDAITIAVAPADDPPPSKRPRGGAADNTPAKIFFKTKLCGRFRAGTCNFANCSFAHGMEELRRPPGNWQEEERGLKGRFVQEEQGRARESVAITGYVTSGRLQGSARLGASATLPMDLGSCTSTAEERWRRRGGSRRPWRRRHRPRRRERAQVQRSSKGKRRRESWSDGEGRARSAGFMATGLTILGKDSRKKTFLSPGMEN